MTADEQAVLDAESALRKAITTQNWPDLEALLHPDLIYTHATAAVQNKAEYLAGIQKGAHRYACERRNLTVRVYGDTALLAGRQINTTVGLGVTYHQVIQLWHRADGRWLLEAQQSTRVPNAEAL